MAPACPAAEAASHPTEAALGIQAETPGKAVADAAWIPTPADPLTAALAVPIANIGELGGFADQTEESNHAVVRCS